MARLNQLYANDYPSQSKIHLEFAQLIAFLQSTERGSLTLTEQLDKVLDSGGAVKSTFIELRKGSSDIEYRVGGGSWTALVALSDITGPTGPGGAGSGDMNASTYDPDLDGRIATAQLNIADGDLTQAKVSGLETALDARVYAEVGTSEPGSPTYPPSGPIHFWLDTSNSASPTWKYWDGVGTWRTLGSATSSSTTDESRQLSLLAGESIASRSLVHVAPIAGYGTNLATGGTAMASAGTAANAFDGNTATECDTASTTGDIGYDAGSGNTMTVGLVEIDFATGTRNHQLVFEVSDDDTTYTAVRSEDSAVNYTGATKCFFTISSPTAARYFQVRAAAGSSNLNIREMKLYEREIEEGQVYKADDDASPARAGRIYGVAQEAGTTGSRFSIIAHSGIITDMSGLTSSTLYYTSTTAGGLSSTPAAKALPMGEAKSATIFNFHPSLPQRSIGEIIMFAGTLADLPHGVLACDGTILSREQYAALYAVIGTIHGSGDGQTSFALPDLRDQFILAANQDDSGVAKTNYTGSLTQSGGARAAQVTTGGGGSNVTPGTPTVDLQVNLDPPYYAMAFGIQVW